MENFRCPYCDKDIIQKIYTEKQVENMLRILAILLVAHDCYSFCITHSNCKGFKSLEVCTEKLIEYAINNPMPKSK